MPAHRRRSHGKAKKQLQQNLAPAVHRVAELIADFSVLRQLGAFREFEHSCAAALEV
jgi:hypothetical protein